MGSSSSKSQPRPYPLLAPGYYAPPHNPTQYLPPHLQPQPTKAPSKQKSKSKRNGSVSDREKMAEVYVQGWRAGQIGVGPQPPFQPPAPRQPLAENNRPIDPPPVHSTAPIQRNQTPFAGGATSVAGTSVDPPLQERQRQPPVSQPVLSPQQERAQVDIATVLQPLPTPNPGVYGPPPQTQVVPRTLANPLPPPPRDLYELSPYNTLLNLPQTTALLTAAYNQEGVLPQSYGPNRGNRSAGLLRALTGGRRRKEEVRFVPVFINGQSQPPGGTSSGTGSAAAVAAAAPPPPQALSTNQRPSAATSSHTAEPVRFSASSFPGFLNYSPHRIMFNDVPYPSAMHLYEAMKFLPDHPELAERIRLCPDVAAVYPLSQQLQNQPNVGIRSDWNSMHLERMEEAILNKFRQHPDLRAMLLGTGDAPLIYADERDVYWGEGTPGQGGLNHLGHILERVRTQLQRDAGLGL